ncbi:MAG: glycosyltransferase family 4 protein [Elusimicrobia bacterium]|nr:glycosyltransferase family 4 protein [Elusimicrobiota bacterium]
MADELRRARHDARILSLKPGGRPQLELRGTGKTAPVVWCSPATRGKTLARAIKSFRPDTVALHFAGRPGPWLTALLALRRKKGFRLALVFQDYRHPDLPPLTASHKKHLRRALLEADKTSAISSFVKNRLKQDFPDCAGKIRVIPNGAHNPAKTGKKQAKTGCILCVGRLAHYKGTDLLLMAYAAARQAGLRSRLVLCGGDFQIGRLRKFAERLGLGKDVEFTGVLSPERAAKLMRDCLYFCLFSRFESFGMAALEAMACGKAVLLSGAGGMRDFAAHNRNALLVNPRNTARAAKLLLLLEKDARLRARLGAAGRKTAAAFDWAEIARKYLDFYRG